MYSIIRWNPCTMSYVLRQSTVHKLDGRVEPDSDENSQGHQAPWNQQTTALTSRYLQCYGNNEATLTNPLNGPCERFAKSPSFPAKDFMLAQLPTAPFARHSAIAVHAPVLMALAQLPASLADLRRALRMGAVFHSRDAVHDAVRLLAHREEHRVRVSSGKPNYIRFLCSTVPGASRRTGDHNLMAAVHLRSHACSVAAHGLS